MKHIRLENGDKILDANYRNLKKIVSMIDWIKEKQPEENKIGFNNNQQEENK